MTIAAVLALAASAAWVWQGEDGRQSAGPGPSAPVASPDLVTAVDATAGRTPQFRPAGTASNPVTASTSAAPAPQAAPRYPAAAEADMAGDLPEPGRPPAASGGPSTSDRGLAGPNVAAPGPGRVGPAVDIDGGGMSSAADRADAAIADGPGPSEIDLGLPGPLGENGE